MEEHKIKILKKYCAYRRSCDGADEVIDNIFYKEIYWPNYKDEKCYLFKNFESIKRFFEAEDLGKKVVDNIPRMLGGKGPICGTMLRNASICNNIDKVIYTRIYEELKKRDFRFEKLK